MLVHEAFDQMLKCCGISAKQLTEVTGISASRISQFRNGTFLTGKGSDLTSRGINELLLAANQLNNQALPVFSLLLLDKNPASLLESLDDSNFLSTILAPKDWNSVIESLSPEETAEITWALANKYSKKQRKNSFVIHNHEVKMIA
jgi:hypothetical protein